MGCAVVPKAGMTPPTLQELRAGLKSVANTWMPKVLVLTDAIPKGPTGKPKRIGLAKMWHVPMLSQQDMETCASLAVMVRRVSPAYDHGHHAVITQSPRSHHAVITQSWSVRRQSPASPGHRQWAANSVSSLPAFSPPSLFRLR